MKEKKRNKKKENDRKIDKRKDFNKMKKKLHFVISSLKRKLKNFYRKLDFILFADFT